MGVQNPLYGQPLVPGVCQKFVRMVCRGGTGFLIVIQHRVDDDTFFCVWIAHHILHAECARVEKPRYCGGLWLIGPRDLKRLHCNIFLKSELDIVYISVIRICD